MFTITGLDGIESIAKDFLVSYPDQHILAFWGPMGVGKTTFIKALCKTMGVEDTVNSPSFAIINEYTTSDNATIYHFDFYRIKRQEEAFDLGYEDYFYSGAYCFMEWPEKIEDLLPEKRLDLFFELLEDGSRAVRVEKRGNLNNYGQTTPIRIKNG
ncbi:MAG: tRNA (adenosine(37)-N6)-threonylcarbamoyltransferase complex ATPase subunit type 1 TsaE [Breznakibacter sp.]